jgi:hypothetical protein
VPSHTHYADVLIGGLQGNTPISWQYPFPPPTTAVPMIAPMCIQLLLLCRLFVALASAATTTTRQSAPITQTSCPDRIANPYPGSIPAPTSPPPFRKCLLAVPLLCYCSSVVRSFAPASAATTTTTHQSMPSHHTQTACSDRTLQRNQPYSGSIAFRSVVALLPLSSFVAIVKRVHRPLLPARPF